MSDNLRLKDYPGCTFHFLTEEMIARALGILQHPQTEDVSYV